MEINISRIEKLKTFKSREKFSDEAWEKRGLNPSGRELCETLESAFNSIADELTDGLQASYTNKELKLIFKAGFKKFDKNYLDTEEKEFICDLLSELARIVEIDINDDLNKRLYGSLMVAMMKVKKMIGNEKVKETILQPCTYCGIALETQIIKRAEGIPDTTWIIAKCNNCNELNLISPGPNVKELKFGNYQMVDSLRKSEYYDEQAVTRLAQLKFYRKY